MYSQPVDHVKAVYSRPVDHMTAVYSQPVDHVTTEADSKEKHGVWDSMPELTISSPYVHSRVDSNTFTMGLGNPMPESTLTLCQCRFYPPVRD